MTKEKNKIATIVNVNFEKYPNAKKYLKHMAVENDVSMRDYIISLVLEDMEKDKEPNKTIASLCKSDKPQD